ncbi:hypothetical protein CO180_00250 [candidate division WWE3 bacterium CG_4_9_14_3_um_filter_41_6]|uniref:Uncharacterized protein n=1 Tax=candidate division WWE3 bacterium CG_4_10_14_0_2_um_filter_41_14 TaxID=1975072 RepID=A0A2M7THL3_UNCKA|nr:MAG: hypothetical protein COY32_04550 [candidate division WWE3 bacterium CG_4_10_14_0_2_um_filter_41_14]PJA39664.1 MAG: hypothetical protein CO180_00250 [candidate division WWE3 bacterium CG_4_9_14_3_um_filter_41_6]
MQFYSVQLKDRVEVPEDQITIVTMGNGRKSARAEVTKDGKVLKLIQFLSETTAAELLSKGAKNAEEANS